MSTTFPRGFRGAGINAGLKNRKKDCGILLAERAVIAAAVLTVNRCRAPNIDRIQRIIQSRGPVRAVLAISGNANALNGPKGQEDDEALAGALAQELGIEPKEVLTLYTGVIGRPLPLDTVVSALPRALAGLEQTPQDLAESIMTTDRVAKIAAREVFIGGAPVRIVGVVKGAGMIAPSLATMLGLITTDAALSSDALERSLKDATADSFNMLTVDDDMSTNDAVVLLASGDASNPKSSSAPTSTTLGSRRSAI
ncbi:MAG: hypothetical protein HC923_05025 [Myxococcales bacterium]|nr:hypothetical protein [Myxococcales bacterium]